jgi:hypothetical protein
LIDGKRNSEAERQRGRRTDRERDRQKERERERGGEVGRKQYLKIVFCKAIEYFPDQIE